MTDAVASFDPGSRFAEHAARPTKPPVLLCILFDFLILPILIALIILLLALLLFYVQTIIIAYLIAIFVIRATPDRLRELDDLWADTTRPAPAAEFDAFARAAPFAMELKLTGYGSGDVNVDEDEKMRWRANMWRNVLPWTVQRDRFWYRPYWEASEPSGWECGGRS